MSDVTLTGLVKLSFHFISLVYIHSFDQGQSLPEEGSGGVPVTVMLGLCSINR